MTYTDEGYRWALRDTNVTWGRAYFRRWNERTEKAEITNDRYAAKTWARSDTAVRHALTLSHSGHHFEPVQVFL